MGCDMHVGAEAVIHVVGPTPRCVMTTFGQPDLPRNPGVLKTIASIGRNNIGPLGQFACVGSYAEVVTPGVVRRGDPVRIERVQPRQGALAATIDMMTAALAAGS
jgi:MOSC domain-containing protein